MLCLCIYTQFASLMPVLITHSLFSKHSLVQFSMKRWCESVVFCHGGLESLLLQYTGVQKCTVSQVAQRNYTNKMTNTNQHFWCSWSTTGLKAPGVACTLVVQASPNYLAPNHHSMWYTSLPLPQRVNKKLFSASNARWEGGWGVKQIYNRCMWYCHVRYIVCIINIMWMYSPQNNWVAFSHSINPWFWTFILKWMKPSTWTQKWK